MIVHEKAKIKTLYIKIRFIAEYRFGNDDSKGGFERCLKVSAGNSLGLEIDGHRFFGTDKFGVDTALQGPGSLVLHLAGPLSERENGDIFKPFVDTVELFET